MKLETQLLSLSERLKDAVSVTYTAPLDKNQGYPYATGYAKSAMQSVIEDLERMMQQINESQTIDF